MLSAHGPTAKLGRLAFRLAVVLVLSLLWSGDAPARAAGLLSCVLGVIVLWAAYSTGEKFAGSGLNRWHEGAFLVILGGVLLIWFGREPSPGGTSTNPTAIVTSLGAKSLYIGLRAPGSMRL
ncbi:hypothetical protein M2427_003050 [Bradyrhizobium sp. BR13661]|jgi:hypothetical protein|nr:hypothetical protein [Bradyrhizobium sp. BR13661]